MDKLTMIHVMLASFLVMLGALMLLSVLAFNSSAQPSERLEVIHANEAKAERVSNKLKAISRELAIIKDMLAT